MEPERLTEEEWKARHAARNAAKRRTSTIKCVRCGNEFVGLARSRYCSGRCKVAWYRARNKTTPETVTKLS